MQVNVSSTDPFSGYLVCESQLRGVEPYKIPLQMRPCVVTIAVDDYGTLNFGRQPIGESTSIIRQFTNTGAFPLEFKVRSNSAGLSIKPYEGSIKAGATIAIEFVFRPVDKKLQTSPIRFETDCTQPLELNVYGGGGTPKISLDDPNSFVSYFVSPSCNTSSQKQVIMHSPLPHSLCTPPLGFWSWNGWEGSNA